MSISCTTRPAGCGAAPPLRLGPILALTAFLAFGAGAPDANAAQGPETQVFNIDFSGVSLSPQGGAISGSAILTAEPVFGVSGGGFARSSLKVVKAWGFVVGSLAEPALMEDPMYPLSLLGPNSFLGNTNLLVYGAGGLMLDSISFSTGGPRGNFNIMQAGMNYQFTTEFAGSGTGSLQVTPGPTPGTGLAGFAFLILAGAGARAAGALIALPPPLVSPRLGERGLARLRAPFRPSAEPSAERRRARRKGSRRAAPPRGDRRRPERPPPQRSARKSA
jgi:hypothetical protein